MIWNAVSFLTVKVQPDVDRLRRISMLFFVLWITDLTLSIYCECLVLNANALVVFNIWVSLAGAAVSQHYTSGDLARPRMVGAKTVSLPPRDNDGVNVRGTSPLEVSGSNGTTIDGFCFGLKRFHVLMCFGAAVFVFFGCLSVIGECVHHFLHPPDTSPLLLLTLGIFHVALFTYYRVEIDAYDSISGQPVPPVALETVNANNSTDTRKESTASPSAVANTNVLRGGSWRPLRETVARAAAPLVCVASCLIMWVDDRHLWDLICLLLLAAHTSLRAVSSGKVMAALLLNNVVQQPADVAACGRALRSVRLTDGVLSLKSSIVWDVAPGERMALVGLRLTSDADPSAVCAAARRILAGIATYVFVEARTTNEEEEEGEDDDEINSGNVSPQCWEHQREHHHHHSHSHSHSHNNCENHDPCCASDNHHGCHSGYTREGAHLAGTNEDLCAIDKPGREVDSSGSVDRKFTSFPQPPNVSAADYMKQQTKVGGTAVGAHFHTTKATQSFNVVPPPFPKPPHVD